MSLAAGRGRGKLFSHCSRMPRAEVAVSGLGYDSKDWRLDEQSMRMSTADMQLEKVPRKGHATVSTWSAKCSQLCIPSIEQATVSSAIFPT